MSRHKRKTKPLTKECDSLLRWSWNRLKVRRNKPKKALVNPRIVRNEERSSLALIIDNEVIETVASSPRLSAILLSEPVCVELTPDSEVTIGWVYDSDSKTFSPALSE